MSLKSRRVKTAILAVFVALAFVLPLVPPGGTVVSASAMDHCGLIDSSIYQSLDGIPEDLWFNKDGFQADAPFA